MAGINSFYSNFSSYKNIGFFWQAKVVFFSSLFRHPNSSDSSEGDELYGYHSKEEAQNFGECRVRWNTG